jgi:hypothetical protein
MNEFDNLERLTAITKRMRKSPWRKITFVTLLVLALGSVAFLSVHGLMQNAFAIACALAVAGISAFVLVTGYAVRRF